MTNSTLSIGGGDPIGSESFHTPPQPEPKGPRRERAPAPPRPDSGQRLIIQQDADTGDCVYTVTDRDSGEVLARISREDVARMGREAGYAAGALIKAKA